MKAVELYLSENPDVKFEIHFCGTHRNFQIPAGLADICTFHDELPYKDVIPLMASMDANLLLEPIHSRKGVFTGKVFEYVGVHVPIFAAVDTDDVAAKMIEDFSCGYVCDFEDIKAQVDLLNSFIKDRSNGIKRIASIDDAQTQHRRAGVTNLGKEILKRLS